MTNDDLTPEEREALSSLPRERTPSAGLEDRVVAAMREHGHITRRPARIIRLTTTRVAGLVAACVALMIGAYSIGLHNRINNEVLKNVEPESRQTTLLTDRENETGAQAPAERKDQRTELGVPAPMSKADQRAHEPPAPTLKWNLNVPKLVTSKDEKKKESPARSDEATESLQNTFSEGLAKNAPPGATDLSAPMSPMPAQVRAKSSLSEASGSVSAPASTSRRFSLNGGTLIVDAPDSLRIVKDEHGRSLLIYTSDGVIRIRLAD